MNVDLTWDQIIEGLREARFMREQEVREVLSTIDTTWNVMAIILDYVLEQVTASKQGMGYYKEIASKYGITQKPQEAEDG